jgi:hypothetical protein
MGHQFLMGFFEQGYVFVAAENVAALISDHGEGINCTRGVGSPVSHNTEKFMGRLGNALLLPNFFQNYSAADDITNLLGQVHFVKVGLRIKLSATYLA